MTKESRKDEALRRFEELEQTLDGSEVFLGWGVWLNGYRAGTDKNGTVREIIRLAVEQADGLDRMAETGDMWDLFEYRDFFGVSYDVDEYGRGELEYSGAEILTGVGGPTTWITTKDGQAVAGASWGGVKCLAEFGTEARDSFDEIMSDRFEALKGA